MPDTPRPQDVTTPVGGPASRSRPSSASSVSSHHGRYLPGAILLDRYRIVDRIGRGGMGEVYRADDLRLDQVVALKFLPEALEHDPDQLARLLGEVRLARQVSHPNLCRVYDIDEAEGRHFLSMEFVDGEDLESLLRRVGRPGSEKALEWARQICAGLAAAHDQQILHRDLKPANVMIDGRGRARITDFGLAIGDGDARGAEVRAGTPAYMAPEQWSGREVTVRSDVYALGLVLYELFTGRRAFDSDSPRELARLHSSVPPPSPSGVVAELDPAIERAILRCLEKDPENRPATALAVSAALPGGDPLAAALAAGETPSPELVAASGGEGALPRDRAGLLVAALLAGVAACVALSPWATDLGLARPPKPSAVQAERAREILARAGVEAEPADQAGWFRRPYAFLLYMSKQESSPAARRTIGDWGPAVSYVYRQSPRTMTSGNPAGRIDVNEPPNLVSGMATVELMGPERLIGLVVVPPQVDSTAAAGGGDSLGVGEPDWSPFFAAAGLDPAAFRETPPIWVPGQPFDRRHEWLGAAPWSRDVPLRVTAASWRGRAVSFHVRGPWVRPTLLERTTTGMGRRIAGILNGLLGLALVFLGCFLAWRNVRLGRGDRRGAIRLGLALTLASMLAWALTAHHVADFTAEVNQFFLGLGNALTGGTLIGAIYLAVEPYARRAVPHLLVGWARALDGKWRDPRVGRDLLTGAVGGVLIAVVVMITNALPTWIPFQGQTPISPDPLALEGGAAGLAFLFRGTLNAMISALFLFAIFLVLRLVLRRDRWAGIAVLAFLFVLSLGGENPALELPGGLVTAGIAAWIVARHGPLAALAMQGMTTALTRLPLPLTPSAPYLAATVSVLVALVAFAIYVFRTSLGTRRAEADRALAA